MIFTYNFEPCNTYSRAVQRKRVQTLCPKNLFALKVMIWRDKPLNSLNYILDIAPSVIHTTTKKTLENDSIKISFLYKNNL